MKAADLFAALLVAGIVLLLTVGRAAYDAAYAFSPLLIAFAKFALLSTFGETLVSRILTGRFLRPRFGLVPKAIIWGILPAKVVKAPGPTSISPANIMASGFPQQM